MAREEISYDELDKIIDSYKGNRTQKKALLVLKSSCEPFRGKSIPKKVAEKIMSTRISTEELLAQRFFEDEDEALFEFYSTSAEHLNQVIEICYRILAEGE